MGVIVFPLLTLFFLLFLFSSFFGSNQTCMRNFMNAAQVESSFVCKPIATSAATWNPCPSWAQLYGEPCCWLSTSLFLGCLRAKVWSIGMLATGLGKAVPAFPDHYLTFGVWLSIHNILNRLKACSLWVGRSGDINSKTIVNNNKTIKPEDRCTQVQIPSCYSFLNIFG